MSEIIVTLASTEKHYPFDRLSVDFNTPDDELLAALEPVLLEEEGFNIHDNYEDGRFTIKRVEDSQNIFVFPKSTAGKAL